jgi:hypothetical protein
VFDGLSPASVKKVEGTAHINTVGSTPVMCRHEDKCQVYSGIYIVVNKDIYERLAYVQLVKPQLRRAGCLGKTPIDAYD